MWIGIWVGLGILCWGFGFIRVGYVEETGPEINKAFVRPPFLFYLLCGCPTSSTIPKGVVALRSLMSQLGGILFCGYGIIYNYLPNKNLTLHMATMFFFANIIILLCWFLYKKFPFIK